MQVVLSPVQLLSSELFSKYVRGVEKPGALGEVLELCVTKLTLLLIVLV